MPEASPRVFSSEFKLRLLLRLSGWRVGGGAFPQEPNRSPADLRLAESPWTPSYRHRFAAVCTIITSGSDFRQGQLVSGSPGSYLRRCRKLLPRCQRDSSLETREWRLPE
jgi:hypothetical protein